ncbi:MAG: hypothetical protein H0T73_18605 [Ardenticatenales bacterium]|nr:hypothetical protein [Ardenticatenales bacterium]
MWSNQQLDWLFDDWERAVRRSLARRLTHRQVTVLRAQWRLGLAAKGGLLLLPLLLFLSLLLPRSDPLLRGALLFWSALETFLLCSHVALGVSQRVSYSWAFHHSRPLLLSDMAATRDLKSKALLASFFAIIALLCLLTVS